MYKVAIVDDEPVIVRGLTKMIPWESYNCRVVGTAGDGQEGMKLIREQKPDRDFDDAQQAIRLGVTRFLLKPSKMDELEEAVRVMIENLEKQGITGKEDGADEGVGENALNAEGKPEGEEGKEKAEPSEGKEGEETDSPASCFIVKNALAYIEENYREKLKLSDVADQIYVSQWHLSKLLNKHTGQNFSEILNTIRIEKAKELLKDPSLRIGDIAEEVGFLDVAHFSRVFKKQAGISANEYRNTKLGS